MAGWLAQNGLQLSDYEFLRGEERGKMSIYGFVLGSPVQVPAPSESGP